jgi:hypothetical protein
MSPISFSCEAQLTLTPSEIAEQILGVTNWTTFQGYGPLPGIKAAEFELRTPEVIGSRIRVQNTDGSSHVEEITAWQPEHRIALKMQEFSAPFSIFATSIDEIWELEQVGGSTKVIRSLELHARSVWTKPILWLISFLLKRAIDRHLQQMAQ